MYEYTILILCKYLLRGRTNRTHSASLGMLPLLVIDGVATKGLYIFHNAACCHNHCKLRGKVNALPRFASRFCLQQKNFVFSCFKNTGLLACSILFELCNCARNFLVSIAFQPIFIMAFRLPRTNVRQKTTCRSATRKTPVTHM
jgi:hypothetical protein